jgi:hypothetical protein
MIRLYRTMLLQYFRDWFEVQRFRKSQPEAKSRRYRAPRPTLRQNYGKPLWRPRLQAYSRQHRNMGSNEPRRKSGNQQPGMNRFHLRRRCQHRTSSRPHRLVSQRRFFRPQTILRRAMLLLLRLCCEKARRPTGECQACGPSRANRRPPLSRSRSTDRRSHRRQPRCPSRLLRLSVCRG